MKWQHITERDAAVQKTPGSPNGRQAPVGQAFQPAKHRQAGKPALHKKQRTVTSLWSIPSVGS